MAASISKDLANVVPVLKNLQQAARALDNFHGIKKEINPRHARRKALEIRIVRIDFGGLWASGAICLEFFESPLRHGQGPRPRFPLGIEPDELLPWIVRSGSS